MLEMKIKNFFFVAENCGQRTGHFGWLMKVTIQLDKIVYHISAFLKNMLKK
jgi:hypothetical protein